MKMSEFLLNPQPFLGANKNCEIKHNLSLMCRLKELVILGCITFRRRFIPYLSIAQTPVNIE